MWLFFSLRREWALRPGSPGSHSGACAVLWSARMARDGGWKGQLFLMPPTPCPTGGGATDDGAPGQA